MAKHTGFLITFEGGEGGGKTTQVAALKERLIKAGKEVVLLREPGGTVISEQIREVVLSAKNAGITYNTEVMLFQAARAQIYGEIVLPSLEAGKVVVMDRSRDSSVVYQGIVRGFGKDLIDQLNNISTQKTYPNLTILLDIEPKVGLQRQEEAGGNNRFEMENVKFHEDVRAAYLQLANEDTTGRWKVIDASQALDKVAQEIWSEVEQGIKL
jgi:dTMP kinase